MTAFARSFAFILWVTAIAAACSTSYLDQTSDLVTMVRIYAYAAGGLGGLLIILSILSLPRMAAPHPAAAPAIDPVPGSRVALAVRSAAPMVRLKPRKSQVPAASADTPDVLRARARRLFGTAA